MGRLRARLLTPLLVGLLGTVLAAVAGRPALKKHMSVMLTAEHGGNGASHRKETDLQNLRIPFMVWGPGVPRGRNLYALNPSFRDPKGFRPKYSGKLPIRNGDVANLATDVLDLPKVPGSELDASRKLNAFGR